MVVADPRDDGTIGEGVALRCFRGGLEEPESMLDNRFPKLHSWICLLGCCAIGFDSRTAGRADDGYAVAFELVADYRNNFFWEFANRGAAVLLYHPVFLLRRYTIF